MARNLLKNPNGDGNTSLSLLCRVILPKSCETYSVFTYWHALVVPFLSATEDLEFWELTDNGGREWRVEDLPGDCGHEFHNEAVTKYFCTSFE